VEATDIGLLETLREFLGVGSISHSVPQNVRWKPTVVFCVNSIKAHRRATIPFADRYLLPCAKRDQFEAWRQALEAYADRHNVRSGLGRSLCAIEGCRGIVRGRGLCRRHYYRVTGW
jgi:hypothetical protein